MTITSSLSRNKCITICRWCIYATPKILPANILLQLKFSKVARYKINSNKSVAFLYRNDKQAEIEIRETTPFTIATNNIKYLGVTLTKQMKDPYENNFKFPKKEIKENGEFFHAYGLVELT